MGPMQEIPRWKDRFTDLVRPLAYKKKQDFLYLVVHATASSDSLALSCMFYGIDFFVFI